MPITIQEIIASDTISQMVDKTNFNFDQLLLNGGGPAGPIGPAGPTGPAGGRGPKGTTWYEDTSISSPGVSPNVVPPTSTPLDGDYYLQFNGQVWEYNGATWVVTTVDLQGPVGPPGQDGGFGSFFGTPSINNKQTVLPSPTGFGAGANATNEGVPTVLIGGVASNTNPADPSIPLTAAYEIDDALALSISSDVLSLLIHQKNPSANAIKFMGGAANAGDNYAQTSLADLVTMQVTPDDGFLIDVPKSATNAAGLLGFSIVAQGRGMTMRAGQDVSLSSGENSLAYGFPGENGNFNITVADGGGSAGAGNKFVLSTQGTSGTGRIELGNGVINPGTTSSAGSMLLDARYIFGVSTSDILLQAGGANKFNSAGITDVFATSTLSMNGSEVLIGEDLGSANTQGIRLGTSDTGNVTGIKLLSGKPAASAVPTGDGIILKTFGAGEDIRIVTENPGITGGIILSAGPGAGNAGFIDIDSHGANITMNSDGADTFMSTSGSQRIILRHNTGKIEFGDNMTGGLATAASDFRTLAVFDSGGGATFPGIGNNETCNVIQISLTPETEKVISTTEVYNGGGEIIGPFQPQFGGMGFSNGPAIEGRGALHLRGGIDNNGQRPGAVWMYPSRYRFSGSTPTSSYVNGSIRLWSTGGQNTQPIISTRDVRGLTIGMDMTKVNDDLFNIAGDNVSGRTYMYGEAGNNGVNQSSQADQPDNAPSFSANSAYAGTNVGDYYRARQNFKVWGDYTGEHYVSVFGGAQSGPTIENQCFMSGGQGFSQAVCLTGWSSDNDWGFKYKYQWQRVGRVVTGSGILFIQTEPAGGPVTGQGGVLSRSYDSSTATSDCVLIAGSGYNSQVDIGPIPLPMQVNGTPAGGGGNTTDNVSSSQSTLPLSDNNGVNNNNISGEAHGVIDYMNSGTLVVNAWEKNDDDSSTITRDFVPTRGDVRGGSFTSINGNARNGSVAEALWIRMYTNQAQNGSWGSGNYGIIAGTTKFTFTYELNEVS